MWKSSSTAGNNDKPNGLVYPSYEILFNYWVQHSLYEQCGGQGLRGKPSKDVATQTSSDDHEISDACTVSPSIQLTRTTQTEKMRDEDYFTKGTAAYFLMKDAIDEEIEDNDLMMKSAEVREVRLKRMGSVNKLLEMFGIQKTSRNQKRLNMRIQTLITTRRHQAKLKVAAEHQGISCRQLKLAKREKRQQQQQIYVWREHDGASACGISDSEDMDGYSHDSMDQEELHHLHEDADLSNGHIHVVEQSNSYVGDDMNNNQSENRPELLCEQDKKGKIFLEQEFHMGKSKHVSNSSFEVLSKDENSFDECLIKAHRSHSYHAPKLKIKVDKNESCCAEDQ